MTGTPAQRVEQARRHLADLVRLYVPLQSQRDALETAAQDFADAAANLRTATLKHFSGGLASEYAGLRAFLRDLKTGEPRIGTTDEGDVDPKNQHDTEAFYARMEGSD